MNRLKKWVVLWIKKKWIVRLRNGREIINGVVLANWPECLWRSVYQNILYQRTNIFYNKKNDRTLWFFSEEYAPSSSLPSQNRASFSMTHFPFFQSPSRMKISCAMSEERLYLLLPSVPDGRLSELYSFTCSPLSFPVWW